MSSASECDSVILELNCYSLLGKGRPPSCKKTSALLSATTITNTTQYTLLRYTSVSARGKGQAALGMKMRKDLKCTEEIT